MNENVIEILGNPTLFNWYFNKRDFILMLTILLLLAISVYLRREISRTVKSVDYKEIIGKTLAYIVIAIIIGTGLNVAGMELEFAVNHMPIFLFFSVILITAGIQMAECFKYYKNFREVIKRTNFIFIGIIECIVLLLSIMGRLEVIELIAAAIGIVALKMINNYIDNCSGVSDECQMEKNIIIGDCPTVREEDLFESRKRQLNCLCRELDQICGEAFAVAVTGKWGSGKTSFVNALKRKMNQVEFVNIECGIEYDVKAMLMDMSSQIQRIYKRNNVYTSKNGIVDKYFEKIGELVDAAGHESFAKIINRFQLKESGSYIENKAAMNKELKTFYRLTGKRIFFVVDDMDRIIVDEAREILFRVIRESVGLENCITLFMMDYDKLTSDGMGKEFLEKYVNHKFELCDPEFEEIIEKYEEYYLTDSFWNEKSNYIAERGKKCKRDILKNGSKIVTNIQNKIHEIKESFDKEGVSEHDIEINREHLGYLLDAEVRLHNRMNNPRKVKRYLDNIEKMLAAADMVWFANENFINNEYSQENWVETILEVAFLKAFLFEEYDELIKSRSLHFFKRDKKNSYIVEFIISGFCSWYTGSEKKEDVVELVVYKLYALDINANKSEHQKLMEELDTNSLQEENLLLYVNECMGFNFNFERMKKILSYLEAHTFNNQRYKCEVIVNIMSFVSGNYNFYVQGINEIMKNIKAIVDDSRKNGSFNEHEWNMIEHYIRVLQTRIIFGNNSNIRILLGLLHNAELDTFFDENVDSISQLYNSITRINESYPLLDFTQTDNELATIINYFQRVEEMFREEEFRYAESEILYFLKRITFALELLETWFGETEESKSERYYDSMTGEFIQVTLKNADNLIRGLDELQSYVSSHQGDVNPVEAFVELIEKIEILDKETPDYFGKDRCKVITALSNMYEQLQKNEALSQEFGDRWKFCKIRLFRLRRNMKK